jgi:NodT family efflux transporter outer membrane factor (OMF) lipoprotein
MNTGSSFPLARAALATAALLALGACTSLAPAQQPVAPTSATYLEPPPGWMAAAPADTLARGPWWTLFGDPVLDRLAAQVAVDNQTVAAAKAAVEESWAAVRLQRASFFPTLSLEGTANRTHTVKSSSTSTSTSSSSSSASTSNSYAVGFSASWEPDLWGKVGNAVSQADATAQASQADLASALLSAQASFVTDYLSLREADAEIATLRATIEGYQRSLQITQNRYAAAIAQKSDVLQAQTTLASAQADLSALLQTRAALFHAMAVLAGQAPASFQLPAGSWDSTRVPAIPVGLPSELLQRRPDIASYERKVAAANAAVGAARAAWFPSLTLSASAGPSTPHLSDLFNVSQFAWSLGATLAETIFDGGARSATVDEAQANWKQAVANYRQTVLTAFAAVEDQLSNAASLEEQQRLRKIASEAADQTEQEMQNRYKQGLVAYTDVVTAQASALTARRSLLQVSLSRQTAAISMVSALGGGWSTQQLSAN